MRRSRFGASVVAVAAVLAFAGCTAGAPDAEVTASPGVLPPVIVQLGELDGTTVEVALNDVLVLQGDDSTYTAWTAEFADPSIAEFTPGRDDGSAQFDPGITPLKVGETEVSLDNSDSGDQVSFTVKVVAAD